MTTIGSSTPRQSSATVPNSTPPPPVPPIPAVTPAVVCRMFPNTPVRHIEQNLPLVLKALAEAQLADKAMILMALATIRAETESFLPVSEGRSQFNTSPGAHPFDKYDSRADLGNQGPPDGERFKGRGFVQLTGRANYRIHGRAVGLGDELLENPDLANEPDIAAKLLAGFLRSREGKVRAALARGDLAAARRLVNGGTHGIDRFTDAYRIGASAIPDSLA